MSSSNINDIYEDFKSKKCSSNKKSLYEWGKDDLITLCKYLNLRCSKNMNKIELCSLINNYFKKVKSPGTSGTSDNVDIISDMMNTVSIGETSQPIARRRLSPVLAPQPRPRPSPGLAPQHRRRVSPMLAPQPRPRPSPGLAPQHRPRPSSVQSESTGSSGSTGSSESTGSTGSSVSSVSSVSSAPSVSSDPVDSSVEFEEDLPDKNVSLQNTTIDDPIITTSDNKSWINSNCSDDSNSVMFNNYREDYEDNELDSIFTIKLLQPNNNFIKSQCFLKSDIIESLKSDLNSLKNNEPPTFINSIWNSYSEPSITSGYITSKVVVRITASGGSTIFITLKSAKKLLSSNEKNFYALPLFNNKRRRVGNLFNNNLLIGANHGQIPGFKIYKLYDRKSIVNMINNQNILIKLDDDEFKNKNGNYIFDVNAIDIVNNKLVMNVNYANYPGGLYDKKINEYKKQILKIFKYLNIS
jgi:hypothetical protein